MFFLIIFAFQLAGAALGWLWGFVFGVSTERAIRQDVNFAMKLFGSNACSEFSSALKSPDLETLMNAIEGLGLLEVKAQEAIVLLKELSDAPRKQIAHWASFALAKIAPQDHPIQEVRVMWLSDLKEADRDTRVRALIGLASLSTTKEEIKESLTEPEYDSLIAHLGEFSGEGSYYNRQVRDAKKKLGF